MFFEDLAMVMSIGGLILSVTILILSGIVDYIKKEYVIEKRNKGNSNTGEKRNYKPRKPLKHAEIKAEEKHNFNEYNIVIEKIA